MTKVMNDFYLRALVQALSSNDSCIIVTETKGAAAQSRLLYA